MLGVSTLGLSDRISDQLIDLLKQTDLNFSLGVCDQSGGNISDYLEKLSKAPFKTFIVEAPPLGASFGRNKILEAAPKSATHFLFPNDTSRFNNDFIAKVKQASSDFDLIALTYFDNDIPRYVFPPGQYPLTKKNIWNLIEPAMVVSRDVLEAANGFNEQIGTGSKGPLKSGEGTDLLLRAFERIKSTNWQPGIAVLGVPQSYRLTDRKLYKKYYFYGRGYGYLLVHHSFSKNKRIKAIVGPFLDTSLLRKGLKGLVCATCSSMGRAVSILLKRGFPSS